jgi:hypothetical protein
MRNYTFKLHPVNSAVDHKPLDNPKLSIVGRGPSTYVWVGDDRLGCYSFSHNQQTELRRFAERLLNRLNASPKKKSK